MSKRAEEAALKAFPPLTTKVMRGFSVDWNEPKRTACQLGYEQAEKDLALTLEQVVKLDCIIMNMVGDGYNDGYKTRPFYEEVLRRFNEQYRKK